jgi:hypothetical protein
MLEILIVIVAVVILAKIIGAILKSNFLKIFFKLILRLLLAVAIGFVAGIIASIIDSVADFDDYLIGLIVLAAFGMTIIFMIIRLILKTKKTKKQSLDIANELHGFKTALLNTRRIM